MSQFSNVGTPVRVTGTGTTQVKSGSGALLGVSFPANTTGAEVTLWAATTGSGTASAIVNLGTTSNFIPLPMDAPTGIVARVTGAAAPDLTLYWMPR